MDERQAMIVEYLKNRGFATAEELAEVLKVSAITVRREFVRMEEERLIKRVHGGAMPPDNDVASTHIAWRLKQNEEWKRLIAKHAAGLVRPNDVIFLDAGSTCYFVGEYLPENQNVTVITHAIDNVNVLRKKTRVKIIAVGGEFSETLGAFVGPIAEAQIEQLAADKAFIGAAGLNPQKGCVNDTVIETRIKRMFNSQAKESYILADATKFGKFAMHNTIPIGEMKYIITDGAAPKDQLEAFTNAGVKVITASGSK